MPSEGSLAYPIERQVAFDPPAEYARLQDTEPVAQVTLPTGDLAYLVTRYSDVRFVLSDRRFSNDRNRTAVARPVAMARDDSMVAMDPPDHTRLRRLSSRAFTPRRVEQLRPYITQQVDLLLDAMATTGPPADLHRAVSAELPLRLICELLGVPGLERTRLRELAARMVSFTAHPPAEVLAARAELRGLIADLIEVKRADPGDDMLSALVAARDDGDRLTESELVSQTMLLLLAGHETTTNQISNSMVSLFRQPEVIERVRSTPADIGPLVEELLRHDPPGDSGQIRVALTDVEIAGVLVPANSLVLAAIPAADRDPRRFPDPDRIDLNRAENPHLAFGLGVHFCLGASLVRAELGALFPALFTRFPALRLAVPLSVLRWRHGMRLSSYESVPVTW